MINSKAKQKSKAGRKPKKWQDYIDKLCEALENHKGRTQACKYAGCSYNLLSKWIDPNGPYNEFRDRIKKAEELSEHSLNDYATICIVNAMRKDWHAAAWYKERRHPEVWANLRDKAAMRAAEASEGMDGFMMEMIQTEMDADLGRKKTKKATKTT